MRCAYEFQRFEKVAWSQVKKGAKFVYEVIINTSNYVSNKVVLIIFPKFYFSSYYMHANILIITRTVEM